MFKLGKFAGIVRFDKNGKATISVQGDGGPEYLVVIPDTEEVIAHIVGKGAGVEKVSDGIVLKPETIYYLYTAA